MVDNVPRSAARPGQKAGAVRQLEDRLATEYLRLVELTEAKERFLSTVAHELRTPLTSILSSTELLSVLAGLEGAPGELVGIVDRNVVRMLRLIEELSLLAKLEAGQLAVDLRLVDVPELVVEAADRFRAPAGSTPGSPLSDVDGADRERLAVDLDLCEGPPSTADPARIGQILDHLLSNAAKHSPGGGGLTIRAQPGETGWTVTVRDTGIGIPAGELPTIMTEFTRGSNAQRAGIPGAGLGLAISRRLAELHGGGLGLTSVEGEGTTATLRLPFAYAPPRR